MSLCLCELWHKINDDEFVLAILIVVIVVVCIPFATLVFTAMQKQCEPSGSDSARLLCYGYLFGTMCERYDSSNMFQLEFDSFPREEAPSS